MARRGFTIRWDNDVREEIVIAEGGIIYSVLKGEQVVWERTVAFRSGPKSYVERQNAAREQERQAKLHGGEPFTTDPPKPQPTKCDVCDKNDYTDENPLVFGCQRRPSDQSEMCATIAGHAKCFGIERWGPSKDGGFATAKQWGNWIESEDAMRNGIVFLSL